MVPMREIVSAATREARGFGLTLGIVLATNLACDLYASLHARGLYADAAALLVAIYEQQSFFPSLSGSRAAVDALRQTPIVLLSKYTSATLYQCGQIFSFVMLAFPTVLCALCWPIAPRDARGWILFPLAFLLIGFAATSVHAVGEAAIPAAYFWILLFLLFFRVRSIRQQALFLLLCIPAFQLHEGSFLLTAVLMLAVSLRVHAAVGTRHERLFARLAFLLLAAILTHQVSWIIFPAFPGDRAHIVYGLTHFEFLYADQHFNLPLVAGAVALLALSAVSFVNMTQPIEKATRLANMIAVAWVLLALIAVAIAMTTEQSFAPYSQIQARYHPVIISALLGTVMILLVRFRVPERSWMNPATIAILISLCAAQAVADLCATRRWNAYIVDLQSRLVNAHGLIPWEATLNTGDERVDTDWRIFKIEWIIPYMCVVFAPNGVVNAMIDLPKGLTFRPLDPERPDRLPNLRGVDFAPYKRFLITQKAGG